MAATTKGTQAIVLVLVLLLSGPVSQVLTHANEESLASADVVRNTAPGVISQVNIIADSMTNGITIESPADEAIQEIDLTIRAGADSRGSGFNWTDWTRPGMISNGVSESTDGSLGLGFMGVDWNFDKGTDGWSSSSSTYGQRSTLSCGRNGTSGASFWTRGGAVTITSPVVDLSGHQGMALGAWVKQGSAGCGEEPDTNENFYLEYRNSGNSWTSVRLFQGSTAGGTSTQISYNLPSNAYHSNFQVRARQTSGSGTCCDYWFFDDVEIAGASVGNLTTPAFGWDNGAIGAMEEGRYPPVFLDASLPLGSHLNWTVLDGSTGMAIPGYVEGNSQKIDLGGIDWEKHDSLKIHLDFAPNQNGDSPRLFEISGGGRIYDGFHSDPSFAGWASNGSTWTDTSNSISGTDNSSFTSPVWAIGSPIVGYSVITDVTGTPTEEISIDGGPWQNLTTLGTTVEFENLASNVQIRFTGNNQSWTLSGVDITLLPSSTPTHPIIDIDADGKAEWGVVHQSIGSWGWQDVFANGSTTHSVQIPFFGTEFVDVWIPRDADSLSVQSRLTAGTGQGQKTLALWVGNSLIAQRGGGNFTDSIILELNQSELANLNLQTTSETMAWRGGGSEFIQGKVELIADPGWHEISGLSIGYDAVEVIEAGPLSDLVMSANFARLDAQKAANLPVRFSAATNCLLEVIIDDVTSSDEVDMGMLSISNLSSTLSPSQKWHDLSVRTQVHSSAPNMLILTAHSTLDSATWMIPLNNGQVITNGASDVLIFRENSLNHTVNGNLHDLNISFRSAQFWEDQLDLRLEIRVYLDDGVVSMPTYETWTNPAIDNDMLIQSVQWFDDDGNIPVSNQYLKAEENLSLLVDIGFENGEPDEAPFNDEFELSLYRDDVLIANTTKLSGQYWSINTTTPFTSGEVEWRVELNATAGGGLAYPSMTNRTFVVDPLAPVVASVNIRHFDHLVSSAYQVIVVNVTDQPVLPDSLQLMIWREWADDLNNDDWPNEGEYIMWNMNSPMFLDNSFGNYVGIFDDSQGFPGDKVAGYVTGQDKSGHRLMEGGSASPDDHLFMYQLRDDGTPVVDTDGLAWESGRKAWLHPGQTYELNASFSEPNGMSDISTVEVALADNIASDRLAVTWDSESRQCQSDSEHLEVKSCRILSSDGSVPDPYSIDLILQIEIIPEWTMPDLGDTRREPMVTIYDRAGNTDSVNYPQNRWRFSAEMMVTEEIDLWVEKGQLTDEGARVSPVSPMELSGIVIFSQSAERPNFDCEINVMINGFNEMTTAVDGMFTASLNAPVQNGRHALTWSVGCLPAQGSDTTSQIDAVRWILVDDVGPMVVEFTSPRPGSIIEAEMHEIRVIVSENFGIDTDSVELIWWLTTTEDNTPLESGRLALTIEGEEDAGLRLAYLGQIDLSGISPSILETQMVLKVRLEGRDLAGNEFVSDSTTNSHSMPAARWDLIHFTPEFHMDAGAVELSKHTLEVDEAVAVQIHIRNRGEVAGTANVKVEIVDLSGNRELLSRNDFEVEGGSVGTLVVDWKPEQPGIQWLEVTLEDEQTLSSKMIDVKPASEEGFLSGILGDADPWLIGITLTLICISMLMILTWLRLATARQGESEGWEYEYEEEDSDY